MLEKEEGEQGRVLINLSEQYKHMGFPNDYWQLNNMKRVCDFLPHQSIGPGLATVA